MPEQLTQENNEKNKEKLEKILDHLERRGLKGTAPYNQFKEALDYAIENIKSQDNPN